MKPTFLQANRAKFSELYDDVLTELQNEFQQAGYNFSPSSAYGQLVSVATNLTQLILFFVEDSITELNLDQAVRPRSIHGLARLTGHDATRALAARGEARLTYNGANHNVAGGVVSIPQHTRLRSLRNNLEYLLVLPTDEVRLPLTASSELFAPLVQGRIEYQTFTGTGEPLQSISLNIPPNQLLDHYQVSVYVNGQPWPIYESLYDLPFEQPGVLVKTGVTQALDLFFGTGFNGAVPPLGADIRVEYLLTEATAGELPRDSSLGWQWLDEGYDTFGNEVNLNELVRAELSLPLTFAAQPEQPELTKLLAPRTSQALIFARPEHYAAFLLRLGAFSVVEASTTKGDGDLSDDRVVYLFLVPDVRRQLTSAQTYFTAPLDAFLLDDTEKGQVERLLEDSGRMLLGSLVRIVDPTVRRYVLHVNLLIFEGHDPQTVRAQVLDELSTYLLNLQRRDRLPKSDLVRVVELVEGVDSVNLYFLSEVDEQRLRTDPTAELLGLDDFGDILIGDRVLPLVRGGWTDRNGVFYEDGVSIDKPCSVNVTIRGTVPQQLTHRLNRKNLTGSV